MNKETRHNLIFIVILLVFVMPGAVILFRKKLDPNARKMYLPDPVDHRIAYMDEQPVPGDFKRFVPAGVAEWITRQSPARGIDSPGAVYMPIGEDGLPVMSDKRIYQVAAIEPTADGARVGLIAWSGSVGGATDISSWGQVFAAPSTSRPVETIATTQSTTTPAMTPTNVAPAFPAGDRAAGRVSRVEEMAIPEDIRKALSRGGLFKPPQRVRWILVDYADVPPGSQLVITVRFGDIAGVLGDSAVVMVPERKAGVGDRQ